MPLIFAIIDGHYAITLFTILLLPLFHWYCRYRHLFAVTLLLPLAIGIDAPLIRRWWYIRSLFFAGHWCIDAASLAISLPLRHWRPLPYDCLAIFIDKIYFSPFSHIIAIYWYCFRYFHAIRHYAIAIDCHAADFRLFALLATWHCIIIGHWLHYAIDYACYAWLRQPFSFSSSCYYVIDMMMPLFAHMIRRFSIQLSLRHYAIHAITLAYYASATIRLLWYCFHD